MRKVRPSRSFYIATGLTALILLFLFAAFRPERIESWQVYTVIHQDIGPREGDLKPGLPAQAHGPVAFTLDSKGNLIVCDLQQNVFARYDTSGREQGVTKLTGEHGLPSRIEIDETGTIYGISSDRKSVIRYNADGSTMPVYSASKNDIYFIEGIGAYGTGTLYVQDVLLAKDHYTRRLTRVSPGGEVTAMLSSVERSKAGDSKVAPTLLQAEVDDFVVARDGSLIAIATSLDPMARNIIKVSPSGKTVRFTIRERDFFRSCRLLGVDGQGNIYVGESLGKEPIVTACKYNSTGYFVSKVPLRGITGLDEIYGRVDQTGNLYITRVSETGFYIDKYSVKAETRWVPRIFGTR